MTIFPGDKRIVMYVIRLKNCCFFANHGVFDEEKTLGQRFHVDAEIHVDALPALDENFAEMCIACAVTVGVLYFYK